MPTVEIPADWIPDGYELTGRMVTPMSVGVDEKTPLLVSPRLAGDFRLYGHAYPELRRKPKLKRIVFEVSGEARTEFKRGEIAIGTGGFPFRLTSDFTFIAPIEPLIRREEYE